MMLKKFKLSVQPGRVITRNGREVDLGVITDKEAEQLLKEDPTFPYLVPIEEKQPEVKATKKG